jgi:hypothetical protein
LVVADNGRSIVRKRRVGKVRAGGGDPDPVIEHNIRQGLDRAESLDRGPQLDFGAVGAVQDAPTTRDVALGSE